MTPLPKYAALLELSQQMQVLARNEDWELLAQVEAQRAAMLASLPVALPTLSSTECLAIADCIRQIQACNNEILEYVTPWREQTAKLLSRLATSS